MSWCLVKHKEKFPFFLCFIIHERDNINININNVRFSFLCLALVTVQSKLMMTVPVIGVNV
jgi:hypothetical protein